MEIRPCCLAGRERKKPPGREQAEETLSVPCMTLGLASESLLLIYTSNTTSKEGRVDAELQGACRLGDKTMERT